MERGPFLIASLGFVVTVLARPTPAQAYPIPTAEQTPRPDPLAVYLESIKEEKAALRKMVAEKDLFAGFREFTREQQVEDFDTYYPIYKAAERQYGIPWELLYTTHVQETAVSRAERPENLSYRGGMQRDYIIYPNDTAEKAAQGWEYLEKLNQRYSQQKGSATTDYKEIMFAAWKMRKDADTIRANNPTLSLGESIDEAQYHYCAAWAASARIEQYHKIQPLFVGVIEHLPDGYNDKE